MLWSEVGISAQDQHSTVAVPLPSSYNFHVHPALDGLRDEHAAKRALRKSGVAQAPACRSERLLGIGDLEELFVVALVRAQPNE